MLFYYEGESDKGCVPFAHVQTGHMSKGPLVMAPYPSIEPHGQLDLLIFNRHGFLITGFGPKWLGICIEKKLYIFCHKASKCH